MSHHFFFYGKPVLSVNGSHMPRPGDYSVDGCFLYDANGVLNEVNYLLDSSAQTAASNCDFVMLLFHVQDSASSIPEASVFPGLRFDVQGDGGSGSYIAANTGTTNAKNVFKAVSSHGSEFLNSTQYYYNDNFSSFPGAYFGTSDITRTGRINAAAGGSTRDLQISFIFCSWNPSSGI